jgi:osmotically-inducible protein OsmY
MKHWDAPIRVTVTSPRPEEEWVAKEVVRVLKLSGRFPSSSLAVCSSPGTVTLRGRVSSYYQKQLAQAAAMAVIGRRQLVNEIEVT